MCMVFTEGEEGEKTEESEDKPQGDCYCKTSPQITVKPIYSGDYIFVY